MTDSQDGIKVIDQVAIFKKLNSVGSGIVSQTPDSDEIMLWADVNGNLQIKNQNGSTFLGGSRVIDEPLATRTLNLSDVNSYIRYSNTGNITVTVPNDATVAWPSGAEIYHRRGSGAGAISLTGSSVNFYNGAESLNVAEYGTFAIKHTNNLNGWDFI